MYRKYCIERLREILGDSLEIFASPAHLDETVKTGIPKAWYTEVTIIRLFGRAYVQLGGWIPAIRADATIVDLNPRSVTAWVILIVRKVLGRRTLAWGHLYPVAGPQSRTAKLRRLMRTLSTGTITYTYSSKTAALSELEGNAVWVAPNSLYPADLLGTQSTLDRTNVIYVGRLVASKKVDVLVRGFAEARKANALLGKLVVVGDGEQRGALESLAVDLNIAATVTFAGWVSDPTELAARYETCFASVSPGYAGLSLTQSVGFGVPILVSRDEPHSPEIELADLGCVEWFDTDEPESLGRGLNKLFQQRSNVPNQEFIDFVKENYSAEAMAQGLADALMDTAQPQ